MDQRQAALPSLAAFTPLVGHDFTVAGAGRSPVSLTLVNADALSGHQVGVAEKFSLCFTPPAGHRIESSIIEMHHPALGNVQLFVCPIGSAARSHESQKLEAIINFTPCVA